MKKIKKIVSWLIRKMLPINKKRIVFTSYNGKYADSPKYIFEKMFKINPNLEYVWLVNDINIAKVPKNIKVVNIDSIKGNYYKGSAHILIDNVHSFKANSLNSNKLADVLVYKTRCFFTKKKNQILYSTWHGTPLKKMDRDQVNSKEIDKNCPNTTLLLGDEYTLKILDNLHYNKVKCLLLGSPRNDILHSSNDEIKKIKKKNNLPLNKKIVLFAPSFRTNGNEKNKDVLRSGINQLEEMDLDKLFKTLKQKFGNDWVFVGRFHYHVEKLINWDEIKKRYGEQVINGNYSDEMAEYLACADILITDVSSCMFDFMITKKPVFLLFPDYDYYLNVERGLYLDIKKLPFPFSKNFNGLIENINQFDFETYKEEVENLINTFHAIDDSKSSQKIATFILKENDLL